MPDGAVHERGTLLHHVPSQVSQNSARAVEQVRPLGT